jgi:hypothetical protein
MSCAASIHVDFKKIDAMFLHNAVCAKLEERPVKHMSRGIQTAQR